MVAHLSWCSSCFLGFLSLPVQCYERTCMLLHIYTVLFSYCRYALSYISSASVILWMGYTCCHSLFSYNVQLTIYRSGSLTWMQRIWCGDTFDRESASSSSTPRNCYCQCCEGKCMVVLYWCVFALKLFDFQLDSVIKCFSASGHMAIGR